MRFSGPEIAAWVGTLLWPFMRIGAMFVVAPIFGAPSVPVRIRLALALALSLVLAPVIPSVPAIDPLSPPGLLIGIHQVIIGLAMGFMLQMVFGALVIGGQNIAMSMGLGFASLVDPQNGVQVPVVSQYYVILATLIFLALNGHLVLLEVVAQSFATLPIAPGGLAREGLWTLVGWAGEMFLGAVLISMPAVLALLLVNVSFGVMTRAAPQLNIFAVGFPITLLAGLLIILLTLPALTQHLSELTAAAFAVLGELLGG